MSAKIQTANQEVFKKVAGCIADVKTIGKFYNVSPVFEMLIDCTRKDVDIDALKTIFGYLVKLDGESFPKGWMTAESAALQNNSASGGVHTSSQGDFYPIVSIRRGDFKTAESRFFSKFWKKTA